MTSRQSFDDNAVEVDSIWFETLMPKRVLVLPVTQQHAPTIIDLGIRITNHTSTAFRFSFHYASPELMLTNDRIIRFGGYFSDWLEEVRKPDFPLVQPGETVTLSPGGVLFKCLENQFRFNIPVGNGGYWSFERLQPGNYQIRFQYRNNTTKVRVSNGASFYQ